MTSSSEELVVRADRAGRVTPLSTPDLSDGAWTRWGAPGVRGDAVVEDTLSTLADRTRAAAHAQGYAVGWAQGMREADAAARRARADEAAEQAAREARRADEHAAAVSALLSAADELRRVTETVRDQLGAQATDLAYAVTAEVLAASVAVHEPRDVVRRVLAVLPDGPVATLRLHPTVARSADVADLPDGVEVRSDASLGPADAVVELSDHVLDLRVDQALARVREVLA